MKSVGAALPQASPVRLLKGHTESVTAVCFPESGGATEVASGSDDGRVRLWDLSTSKTSRCLLPPGDQDDSVGTVSWRGERIAIGRGACVSFFDSRAPTLVCKTPIGRTENHKDDVTQIAFEPDGGHRIVVSDDDGGVRCYDDRSIAIEAEADEELTTRSEPGKEISSMRIERAHTNICSSVQWSRAAGPDAIMTGGLDSKVVIHKLGGSGVPICKASMDPGSAGGDGANSKGKRAKKGSAPPAAPKQQGGGDGRTINPRFVYCLSTGGEGQVAIALGDGALAFAEARTLRSAGEVEVCGGLLAACCFVGGDAVAAGGVDACVSIWRPPKGGGQAACLGRVHVGDTVNCLAWGQAGGGSGVVACGTVGNDVMLLPCGQGTSLAV